MRITFYRSKICPRCLLAGRELKKLAKKFDNLEITEIEVAANPLKTWQDGIKMIPALKSGDKILAGIFLSRRNIQKFLKEQE